MKEIKSLFIPQKERADQAETGCEVILKSLLRAGAQ